MNSQTLPVLQLHSVVQFVHIVSSYHVQRTKINKCRKVDHKQGHGQGGFGWFRRTPFSVTDV